MPSTSSPPAGVPGPPPPPAPPVKLLPPVSAANKHGDGIETDKCFQIASISEEDVKKDIVSFVNTKRWLRGDLGEMEDGIKHFVAVYSHVQPILQQGPVCGLVALSMAGNLVGEKSVEPDRILAEAAQRGYSKKGEMFSVNHMKELASYFYPNCESEIVATTGSNFGVEIVDILIHGNVLLFPYDADFNHGPAVRNGHAAHWAVIHGILCVIPNDDSISRFEAEEKSLNELGSITISNPTNVNEERSNLLKELFFNKNTFAICHQGKSTHTGIWRLEDFIRSNQNLKEIAPKLLNENSMILSDITTGLCGQAVVMKKPEREYF